MYAKVTQGDKDKALVISARDARRIVKRAAPYIKVVSAETYDSNSQKDDLIMFGSHLYKIEGFSRTAMLELLAENATNITETFFDYPPDPRLLLLLVKNNNIRKIKFFELCYAFYEDIPMDTIEELGVYYGSLGDLESFSGVCILREFQICFIECCCVVRVCIYLNDCCHLQQFPNLKNLDLELFCMTPNDLRQMMSLTLPHVLGVTSLHLHITANFASLTSNYFFDIAKLKELENLFLEVFEIDVTNLDSLSTKLATCCPKLKTVKLGKYFIIINLVSYPRTIIVFITLKC